MVVKFAPNDAGNPPGKLADAGLHLSEGTLDGLELVGFRRSAGGGTSRRFSTGHTRVPQAYAQKVGKEKLRGAVGLVLGLCRSVRLTSRPLGVAAPKFCQLAAASPTDVCGPSVCPGPPGGGQCTGLSAKKLAPRRLQ